MPAVSDDSELQRALGRVEGKLDQALANFLNHDGRMDEFDKRVGSVEKKVYWFSGAGAVVAYLAQQFLGKH